MRQPPQRRRLLDGRLHLHDGPIDLIIEAFAAPAAIERAYEAAWRRFETALDELCAELPVLRMQVTPDSPRPEGRIARRMFKAVAPFARRTFITPMAAIAGAVADEIMQVMTRAAPLARAYVNDGGDIALHLAPGESFRIGMIDAGERPSGFGLADVSADSPVRGVATSGWRGRSFSLGIADAVTVLAANGAAADAAATLIANAVDLPNHPAIRRAPARDYDPQSDLGERLVTRGVGTLSAGEIGTALIAGMAEAARLRDAGYIVSAALHLQGETSLLPALRGGGGAKRRIRGGATLEIGGAERVAKVGFANLADSRRPSSPSECLAFVRGELRSPPSPRMAGRRGT